MTDYSDEISQLQEEIDARQAELADLEADVVDLREQLAGFEGRYNRLIVPLQTRLKAVKDTIADLEATRWRSGGHPLGDDNPMQDFWTPPPDYVPVEEQFRRTWHPDTDSVPAGDFAIKPKSHATAPSPVETNIKKLYRDLARRFHPDMTTDDTERVLRNNLMAQINDAYARRDLSALQMMARQRADEAPRPLDALRVEELRQINRQLRERLSDLRLEKADIQHSDMLRLSMESKLVASRGRDLLAEMVLDLEREYDEAMLRLERLRRNG